MRLCVLCLCITPPYTPGDFTTRFHVFEVVSSLNLLLKPTVLCCLKSSVQQNFFSVTNTTGLCFEAYGGSGLGLGPEKGKMTFFATKTSLMCFQGTFL